jgi:nicotinamide riboside kinase
MVNLRIGMCGAGSTGKTTIAESVAVQFCIPFLPSVARSVMVDEWGLDSEMAFLRLPANEQDQCQDMLFTRRLQAELTAEQFVGDRTVLDHAAYRLLHCAARMADDDVDDMLEKTVTAMRRLSLVFFFPSGNLAKRNDAFRNGSAGMRSAIDALIRGMLDRHAIKHVVVPSGDQKSRFAFVDRHVFMWKRTTGGHA